MITFPNAYVFSLSGKNPALKGKYLESLNDHGDRIRIDVSAKPPSRSLSLNGSEYDLATDAPIGELQVPQAEFLEQREHLTTQIGVLNALQSNTIQEHLEDLTSHGYSLANIKNQLLQAYGLDISFINSLDDLTNPARLAEQQQSLEEKLHALEQHYVKAMKQAIGAHREKIFELDEKTREILQFISNIGFDLIPKKFSDQIIGEVKSGLIVISKMSINPARLQLEHGRF